MIPKHIYDEAKKFVNGNIEAANAIVTDDLLISIFNKDKARETPDCTAHTIMDANVIIHRYEKQQAAALSVTE